MPVPSGLSKKLRESIGQETGEDLVTWLNEMRTEHDELRAAIRADFAEFRSEMAALIQASESRMVARIANVEVRVAEVKADLMKWSFVFWVGAVAAIAMLAGVLRS